MPGSLDFRTLRDQIEAATFMPDFAGLRRRAKRVRRRDRLAVVGALFGTLAVFAPVALASIFGRPVYNPSPVGPDPNTIEQPTPSPTGKSTLSVQVRAATGALPDSIYAAVDVCLDNAVTRRCNLQVTMMHNELGGGLTPASNEQVTPFTINALRDSPADRLDDVELVPLTSKSVLLSGVIGANPRINMRVTQNGATAVQPPPDVVPLGPGDRAFQLDNGGDIYGARQSDGALSRLANQPVLGQRHVISAIPPSNGWWVTGTDPRDGRPTIAVSRDQGRTWTIIALSAPPNELDTPTLATFDGQTVHAYLRYANGIRQFKTTDGGLTWAEVHKDIALSGLLGTEGGLAGREFGALARSDKSVLLWIQDVTKPVFLNSPDGETFTPYASGPTGDVVAVEGGYVTLGAHPALSADCTRWTPARLPSPVQPR
jgi:hypothetical protein